MSRIERGNHFLGGFGTENYLEDFFLDRTSRPKPLAHISENDDEYLIEVGIPGFGKEDMKLSVEGKGLTVTAHKESDEEQTGFQQTFYLPNDIRREDISAAWKNDILTVRLPKETESSTQPHLIKIR